MATDPGAESQAEEYEERIRDNSREAAVLNARANHPRKPFVPQERKKERIMWS